MFIDFNIETIKPLAPYSYSSVFHWLQLFTGALDDWNEDVSVETDLSTFLLNNRVNYHRCLFY